MTSFVPQRSRLAASSAVRMPSSLRSAGRLAPSRPARTQQRLSSARGPSGSGCPGPQGFFPPSPLQENPCVGCAECAAHEGSHAFSLASGPYSAPAWDTAKSLRPPAVPQARGNSRRHIAPPSGFALGRRACDAALIDASVVHMSAPELRVREHNPSARLDGLIIPYQITPWTYESNDLDE